MSRRKKTPTADIHTQIRDIQRIMQIVAERYRVPYESLVSRYKGSRAISHVRHIAVWVVAEVYECTYVTIGIACGRRSNTMARLSHLKIESFLDDEEAREPLEALKASIKKYLDSS